MLLVVGLLCGGLMSLLLLNTVLARDSITAGELREDIANARRHNDYLRQENERATQPDAIATQAEQQGLTRDTGINPLPVDDDAPLPGKSAEPGPRRGADPGPRPGAETGATTGTGTGTGTGAETGAEVGATTGTETGARSGAEAGADSGTESGAVGRTR